MRHEVLQLTRLTKGVLACASVTVVLVACGGGGGRSAKSGGGSKSGHTVNFVQYEQDAANGGPPGSNFGVLWLYDPASGDQLSASDCTAAQGDVNRLVSDTAAWPAVLKQPMDSVEKDEQTAISTCSSGDFPAMVNAVNQAKDGLTATQNAFAAHCKETDDSTTRSC
jgi:hypothetical protein